MLIADRCQVAIAQEAAAGTAESLAAGNVVMATELPTWEPEVTMVPRSILSASLAGRGHVTGARMARIRFKMHLRGTAAAMGGGNPADHAVPLKACGLDVTYSGGAPNEIATWAPSSTIISDATTGSYVTAAIYIDGKQYKIHGAQGNVRLILEAGSPGVLEFDLLGIYNTPTDVALLVPTYPATIEPPFASAAMTVLGYSSKLKGITLDLGNRLGMRPSPNTASGFFSAQITGRNTTFTIEPEEELAATKDYHAALIAATTGSVTTGTWPSTGTNYNQFNLTIPKAQFTKVNLGNRDGVTVASIEGVPQANSDAGEDDLTLVHT